MVFATILCIRNVEEYVKETIHHSKLIIRTREKKDEMILKRKYVERWIWTCVITHKSATTLSVHKQEYINIQPLNKCIKTVELFFIFFSNIFYCTNLRNFFMTASRHPFIVTKFSKWEKKKWFFRFSTIFFVHCEWTFFTWIHFQALQYDSVLHFCALCNKNIF